MYFQKKHQHKNTFEWKICLEGKKRKHFISLLILVLNTCQPEFNVYYQYLET